MLSLNDLATPLNPLVLALLRSPLHGVASKGLMLLTWTGRKSGREYTIPVGYQRNGQSVVVMISKVSEKSWWKNFREPWPATLTLRGRVRTATGVLLEPGSDEYFECIETTLKRLPWMGRQFGIAYERGRELAADQRETLLSNCGAARFDLEAHNGPGDSGA